MINASKKKNIQIFQKKEMLTKYDEIYTSCFFYKQSCHNVFFF